MTTIEQMIETQKEVDALKASGMLANFAQFSKKATTKQVDTRFHVITPNCNCGINGCGISKKNGGLGHAGY